MVGKRPGWNLVVMGMHRETRVIMWFRNQNYMVAYFQAAHAAPGQWLIET